MSIEFVLSQILPYVLLAFAVVICIDYWLVLPATMVRTQGRVDGHNSRADNDGGVVYAARFSYVVDG